MNSEEFESLSERNINTIMKKIKHIQLSISPIAMTDEDSSGSSLKAKLLQIFRLCCQFSNVTNDDDLMEYHLEIRKLLDDVKAETSQPMIVSSLQNADRYQRLKLLFDWAKRQGICLDNVELLSVDINGSNVVADSKQFGLKLTKDLKRGDEVFTIPKNVILTADYFLKDKTIGDVARNDPLLNTMSNILLAFGLLIECYKKNDSLWKPYLDSLPASYSNVCSFTVEDFASLKGSSLYWDALSLWTSCVRQYVYLHMKFLDCDYTTKQPIAVLAAKYDLKTVFNLGDYLWAASTIMTRMNPIPVSTRNSHHTLGLIPIMDLCNYTDTIYSVDFDVEHGVCKVLCPNDLHSGDELRIFYGARPTSLLLIYNGFFYENNSNDFFIVSIDRLNTKVAISNRADILRLVDLYESNHHPLSMYANAWSGDLRRIYRILNCSVEEKQLLLDLTPAEIKTKVDGSVALSVETELKALNQIKTHIQSILDGYVDRHTLPPTNSNSYISVSCERYVENEKKILQKAIHDFDAAIREAPNLYFSEIVQ